ncbi:MAG: ice-binding family protein [Gemmatimonadota bacterium]
MTSPIRCRRVNALHRRAPLARLIGAVALSGLLLGACDVHGVTDPGTITTITVTPNPVTLVAGGTQQFTAVGHDFDGVTVTTTPTWTVVSGGGTITSSGLFTAAATPGTFANTVKATSGNLSATATVTVITGPLASITLTPSPLSLPVGTSQQFVPVGKDAAGNVVGFTPTWSVVAGGGTIGASGLFTAGSVTGLFANTVMVSSGGISATASVTTTAGTLATLVVTPNPATVAVNGTQQFVVVGRDASGNPVMVTPTWSVVAGGGTISLTTGLFTAGSAAGTYTNSIRANVGAIVGLATVTVTGGALASVTVTPTPVSMQANGAQQFTATGRDAGGNVVAITPVWSVVNGGGTINAGSGLFTAGAVAGTFANTVRATSGALSGTATVTVTASAPVLATITVTPNPVSVQVATGQQFTAVGKDAGGNVITITPVWSVVNGGGTINSASGLFTAGNVAGTFVNTVTATSGAISGAATVTVTFGAPTSVVNLGAAAPNGIMAGTAVTCITGGTIAADVSISPGNTITGFGPCVITGVQHLNDAVAQQAQLDLTTAYNTLAGMPCPPANAIVANLGGTTKAAGVYCTASGISVTGTLTLDGGGNPNATFVFQAGSSLTTAGNIVLINGAQAKNVFWQVGSSATLGTASQWQGNILALTSITLVDNATLFGRALARNGAVTLGTNNSITLP